MKPTATAARLWRNIPPQDRELITAGQSDALAVFRLELRAGMTRPLRAAPLERQDDFTLTGPPADADGQTLLF